MGEVYLAEDTELDRKVALKFLPVHLCQDTEYRARFKREAQAAAKLSHPNIVTIHEVAEYNSRPYFVMEYLRGTTLKEFIGSGDLPLKRALEVVVQVCEGLAKAHQAEVVHRDIKPANVIVDDNGRARILDFGLAAIKGAEKITQTGSTMGTVGYMSPEQVRGEALDQRSDMFSLGVVLYEMITGQLPFKGEHEPAILYSIQYEEPEPLARYKSGVSPELQRIISKALAKDKSLRYQHADDLAADLRPLVATSAPRGTIRTKKRRILALSLAILALLTLTLILRPWRPIGPSVQPAKRIVVVPFRNQTGDPSLDPMGRMVADWTTQSLLGTGLAEVISPEALLQLDSGKGIRSVVDATGAGMIVTGSYYIIDDSLQFQARVVTADEKVLQAIEPVFSSADKPMEGIEAVRQRVVGALAILLEENYKGLSLADTKPPTYEAYQEYMQGFDDFSRLYDWAGSLEHFNRAFALDTSFLWPLLLAACAYGNSGRLAEADSLFEFLSVRRSRLTALHQIHLEWGQAAYSMDLPKALDAARRGAALAPGSLFEYEVGSTAFELNRPHESIRAFERWNFNVGIARNWQRNWIYLQRAHHLIGEHKIELEVAKRGRERFPTSFALLDAENEALAALGRIGEIKKLIEEALTWPAQSGSSPGGSMRLASEELRAHGHEAEAMELLERAIRWYQSRPAEELNNFRHAYALTLYNARRWAEAKVIYEELAKESPTAFGPQVFLGLIAARQGDRETALNISDRLRDLKTPNFSGSNTYNRACIAAILGDKEHAVALLKEFFLQGRAFSIDVHRDFDFESLWDYPPFIELLKPKG